MATIKSLSIDPATGYVISGTDPITLLCDVRFNEVISHYGSELIKSGGAFTSESGSVATFSGTFGGTPTGGTLNLSAVTVNGIPGTGVSFTQSGTGATARTVDAKLKDGALSVKDFGATGDGSTDDYTAINACFTAALLAGKSVYFPTGTYRITEQLTLLDADGLFIFGEGTENATTIRQVTNSKGVFKFTITAAGTVNNITIRDMRIESTAGTPGTGILFGVTTTEFWDEVRLDNVYFYNWTKGMEWQRVSNSAVIRCDFHNCTTGFNYTSAGLGNANWFGNCWFGGSSTTSCVTLNANGTPVVFTSCEWASGAKAMTLTNGALAIIQGANVEAFTSTTGIFDVGSNSRLYAESVIFLAGGSSSAIPFRMSAAGATLEIRACSMANYSATSINGVNYYVMVQAQRGNMNALRITSGLRADSSGGSGGRYGVLLYDDGYLFNTTSTTFVGEMDFGTVWSSSDMPSAHLGRRGVITMQLVPNSTSSHDQIYVTVKTADSGGFPVMTNVPLLLTREANTWTTTQTFDVSPVVGTDLDGAMNIWRARIGVATSDEAAFMHRDQSGAPTTGFAIAQGSTGATRVNGISYIALTISGTPTGYVYSNGLRMNDGTVSAPMFTFVSDTDCGMYRAGTNDVRFAAGGVYYLGVSASGVTMDKTITAGGTTGAQTINKPAGSVNFAAAATSLVVTNSLVTTSSVIQVTVATNDTTMKSALAVAASGSFTIYPGTAPTAETRVNFVVIN